MLHTGALLSDGHCAGRRWEEAKSYPDDLENLIPRSNRILLRQYEGHRRGHEGPSANRDAHGAQVRDNRFCTPVPVLYFTPTQGPQQTVQRLYQRGEEETAG